MKHQQLGSGIFSFAIVAAAMMASPYAQAPPSALPNAPSSFEVASIKRSDTAPAIRAVRSLPGGRVDAMGVTVADLIRNAYAADGINTEGQIEGAKWIESDRFNVQAKATGLSADAEQAGRQIAVMLKALLAERFNLRLRIEQRERALYDLVVHQAGQTGPTLTTSSCAPAGAAVPGASRPCDATMRFMGGPIGANGITMEALAAGLGTFPAIGRPVRDRTGLIGHYDVRLKFVGVVTPNGRSNPAADSGPNIFTALQEQLGLRLQSGKGPVSVAIVDRVAPPTDD
jgi:uncharacterized protein (TIGR03435 family)